MRCHRSYGWGLDSSDIRRGEQRLINGVCMHHHANSDAPHPHYNIRRLFLISKMMTHRIALTSVISTRAILYKNVKYWKHKTTGLERAWAPNMTSLPSQETELPVGPLRAGQKRTSSSSCLKGLMDPILPSFVCMCVCVWERERERERVELLMSDVRCIILCCDEAHWN